MISLGLIATIVVAITGAIGRWWWKRRQWHYEMHQLAQEMVPYSPLEIRDLNNAYWDDPSLSEVYDTYRRRMRSHPEQLNKRYNDRPATTKISETIVTCLVEEGYTLQQQLVEANEGSEIDHLEFMQSVFRMDASALLIQHQIEEKLWYFNPKKSTKLGKRRKIHAEDLQQHYQSKDSHRIDSCSSLVESYHETNNAPWLPE